MWGPHTVDRFADELNCKIKRFNSRYWCPQTEHVDAFSTNWAGENNWLVPPINQVGAVLAHIAACAAVGTLVVPEWPSAYFWPLLFSKQSPFAHLVSHIIRLSSTVDEYDRIVAQVTAASRAESTVYKYNRALVGWKDWCTINQVSQIPATAEDISRYMLYMYQWKAPYSRIESFFYALKWQYDCRPNIDNNPCDKNFLHIVLQGLKRLLYKPVVKKEAVTPEILRAIIDNNGASNDLIKVRLCAMVLLAYAAFLRHDELINIRRCDLEIFVSHINIFIMKSKRDIYRQGAWVIVGATNSPTCPVAALNKYLWIAVG
ncbi:uncharacterized protein [Amphiura filiformis]|uniref:uncharacterized protein n=1 Tax=Amphiura filiformis TaxID=82378 RepID=UPI003B212B43